MNFMRIHRKKVTMTMIATIGMMIGAVISSFHFTVSDGGLYVVEIVSMVLF